MRKIFNDRFTMNLSNLKISDTEENSWFSDNFFTKYTFPFEIDLTEEMDIALDFISLYNTAPSTLYNCKYSHNDKIEDAVLEIIEVTDRLICELRFGLEFLPSFDKSIRELTLEKFDLPEGETIYEHAEEIVSQTWPDVNYNFPAVHTDKYDTSESVWTYFEKVINKRTESGFVENDVFSGASRNKNIMQPFPYLLYLLKKALNDDGYELGGDILNDDLVKKMIVFCSKDYFVRYEVEYLNLLINSEDRISNHPVMTPMGYPVVFSYYKKTQALSYQGIYHLEGKVKMQLFRGCTSFIKISYKGNNFAFFQKTLPDDNFFGNPLGYTEEFDVNFLFYAFESALPNEIVIESFQYATSDLIISDLTCNLITLYNEDDLPIPTINNQPRVDLTKSVPDIKVSELFTIVKNYLNYDFSRIEGTTIFLDSVKIDLPTNDAINLSELVPIRPRRKMNQGDSYLLKFTDIDSTVYTYDKVFQNKTDVLTTGFNADDKTNTIESNCLPLPVIDRNGILTAHSFENNDDKVYFVIYDGLNEDTNHSLPNNDYLLPVVHERYWYSWLEFRINAEFLFFSFTAHNEFVKDIRAKKLCYCYKNFHLIKTLERTEIAPDLFEVNIEVYTRKKALTS